MLIVRGVVGAIILFLGRELNFLFAGGMAALPPGRRCRLPRGGRR